MISLFYRLISFYQQAISPYFGHRCRYVPSCSDYMKDAVMSAGLVKGIFAGVRRILRCAPWGGSGLDLYEKQS